MFKSNVFALGLAAVCLSVPVPALERTAMDKLLAEASSAPDSPAFRASLTTTLGAEAMKKGEAFNSNGADFVFAVETAKQPTIVIDDNPAGALKRSAGSDVWFYTGKLAVGTAHRFHYMIDGAKFGGSVDVPAYTADSYEKPGVPKGKLSEKFVNVSKVYEGMQSEYWVYAPAQYDPSVPAALMVWQDGERYNARNTEEQCRLCPSLYRLQEVTENLLQQKKIPVMIHVFISPGTLSGRAMRSIQYDTVNDKYWQYLKDDILPEVYKKYNIRKDAYSRAIQGQSSGGIAAFNVAFNHPEEFSRVYTVVASYTALQWKPGELEGGNVYPFKVRREAKKNLRVWMEDGSEDQEAGSGSWPLQNIQMANSLKLKGYEFHFSFGGHTHNAALAVSELAECLTWLWRDYDPKKTEQTFEQGADEKAKPPFRVRIYNR